MFGKQNSMLGQRLLLKTGSPIFNQFCGHVLRLTSPGHPGMGPGISREKPFWFSKYTTTKKTLNFYFEILLD